MVTPASSKELKWHTDILPPATRKALNLLADEKWLEQSEWYLAGGTALALQIGHRSSVDLDFFIAQQDFSYEDLIGHFSEKSWKTDILRKGTVYGNLLGAKVSFIAYPFFKSKHAYKWYGSVRVLDLHDIAVMKVIAISQRGRKRDFIDLYRYCQNFEPMERVLSCLLEQYPTITHNYHHILKSLVYFIDAENEPMPRLFFKATWQEIKSYFEREIPKITRRLLDLK